MVEVCAGCGRAHDTISWRRRRTARWASLSLPARGLVLEVVMAMDDERRELELGPEGLRAVAPLVGRPWEEVEPALLEAIEVGKIVHDPARNVLIDDSRGHRWAGAVREQPLMRHAASAVSAPDTRDGASTIPSVDDFVRGLLEAARGAAIAGIEAKLPKPRKANREPSMTKNAIRLRALRAARAVDRPEPPPPSGTDPRSFVRANEHERTNTTSNERPDGSQTSGNVAPEQRSFAFAEQTPLSDLKYISKSQSKEAPRSFVQLVVDEHVPVNERVAIAMPNGWLARALEVRPDMTEQQVRWLWTKFARAKSGKYDAWGEVQMRFEDWVVRERVGHRDDKPEPPRPIRKAKAPPPPTEPQVRDEASPAKLAGILDMLNGRTSEPAERAA